MTLKQDAEELIEQLEEKDTETQLRMEIDAEEKKKGGHYGKGHTSTRTQKVGLGKPSQVTEERMIKALEGHIEHLQDLNQMHREENSNTRITKIKKIRIREVNPEKAVAKDLDYDITE